MRDRAHLTLRDDDAAAFRASRYYREDLAPHGMSDSMVMLMSREGSTCQYWNVITHDDRGPIKASGDGAARCSGKLWWGDSAMPDR